MSDAELKHRAQCSAIRIILSPHEWTWTQSEQEEMATLILMQNGEIEKLRKVAVAASTADREVYTSLLWAERNALEQMKKALKEAGFDK